MKQFEATSSKVDAAMGFAAVMAQFRPVEKPRL
jgi:hypothetical protein